MSPPDLHGHFWIRVSIACASSGLRWRCASLVRAAPFGALFAALLGLSLATRAVRRGGVTRTS
jgi:hypothetical protein